MLINEVEHIVGLSKKSIRYYEENGLLAPKRNSTNDYRVYDEEDIVLLKKIKFLRELGVPIKELQDLKNGNLPLNECLSDRIHKINLEEAKFKKVKLMCENIKDSDFNSFNIDECFQKINILNKEGFTMRDVKTKKKNKIIGAVLSSIIFSFMFIGIVVLISYFQFTEDEKIPWVLYFIIVLLFVPPIIGIVVNLVKRIKEINGGEEDEASKY